MAPIVSSPLPSGSLLARHAKPGDHGDCYTIDVPHAVPLAAFVEAFYTSAGFRPERLVLALIGRGGNAADARALARGETGRFAAWRVEASGDSELLLSDFLGRTRSWLAVVSLGPAATRLHFGSGIRRREGRGPGARIERALFRLLLPGHAVYSRVLLRSAAARLVGAGADVAV
jgi:hypothetical protein